MVDLMRQIREALSSNNNDNTFSQFVGQFFAKRCYNPDNLDHHIGEYEFAKPPKWVCEALKSVGIDVCDIGSDFEFEEKHDMDEPKEKLARTK